MGTPRPRPERPRPEDPPRQNPNVAGGMIIFIIILYILHSLVALDFNPLVWAEWIRYSLGAAIFFMLVILLKHREDQRLDRTRENRNNPNFH